MNDAARHRQVERFDRFQRQFARAKARREADTFRAELDALVERAASPGVMATPPGTRATNPTLVDPAEKALFEQRMRDLLVRVHSRPSPPVEPSGPEPRSGPWWSPTPVLGFRVWQLLDGRWRGAKQAWDTATRSAECLHRKPGAVPHDVAECGRPACGIYAVKSPEQLLGMVSPWFGRDHISLLLGIVAMTGRVIEHTAGFRAQHARVVAAATVSGTSLASGIGWFTEPDQIEALFTEPEGIVSGTLRDLRTSGEALRQATKQMASHAAVFSA